MKDIDGPIIRMKFNSYSPKIKDEFKIKYPNYYKKLFNQIFLNYNFLNNS